MVVACPIFRQKLKQRGVAQVFFQISALRQIFRVNFRHRQARAGENAARIPGKRRSLRARRSRMPMALNFSLDKPDDVTPRAAELALQRLHLLHRRVEMLLKEFFENVHENGFQRFILE